MKNNLSPSPECLIVHPFSNFENFIKNERKLNFQEDILISQKNCGILSCDSKKENFSKIENDNGILIDRKMKENIQQKIRLKIFSKKPFKEKKKKLGRKIKSDECLGEHNKFSDDNVLRKIRRAVLNNVLIFQQNILMIISRKNIRI